MSTAELVRVGKGAESVPVGVVIRVAKREDLVTAAAIADELLLFARGRLAKAVQPKLLDAGARRRAAAAAELEAALVEYFGGFLSRAGIAKDATFPLDPESLDWKTEAKLLADVLETVYLDLGEATFAAIGEELGIDLSFSLEGLATKGIRDRLARQVRYITEATRQVLVDRVEFAIEHGLSIEQLVSGTSDLVGLEDLFGSRATTIALTETATASNAAAVDGYRESGLVDDVLVFDGPECGWTEHDDPDLADGSTRSLDDADEYPISHPNCQRAFGAVVAR